MRACVCVRAYVCVCVCVCVCEFIVMMMMVMMMMMITIISLAFVEVINRSHFTDLSSDKVVQTLLLVYYPSVSNYSWLLVPLVA